MDDIMGLMGVAATDMAIETNQNQISLENFVVQASAARILAPRGNPQSDAPMEDYARLYDGLVSIGAIKTKWKMASFMTGESVATISPDLNLIKTIGPRLARERRRDFDYLNTKYSIDFQRLGQFLWNYKYSASDQFAAVANLTRRGGRTRRHTRRKHKTRHKNKLRLKCKARTGATMK